MTDTTTPTREARAAMRAWVAAAAVRLGVTETTVRRWIRSGRLNPSCRDVYSTVFAYLDRELSPEQRVEVEHHLAACPGCEEHFAFDGTVLRFVRQHVPRPLIQASLKERLLGRFRGQAAPQT